MKYYSIILASLIMLTSCDGDGIGSNSEVYKKIMASLDAEPENYDACLQIVEAYEDSLQNRELDSVLAKAVMQKIAESDINYVLDASAIKITGNVQKCVEASSAEISFKEYEESWTERNLMKIMSSNIYPLIEINLQCKVIERVPPNRYATNLDFQVPVKGFLTDGLDGIGKFKLKKEKIADYLGPNTAYEMDKNKERLVLLRYKLWDEGEALSENKVIENRTKKVFLALNTLKNLKDLTIELNLYESEAESGGGEMIHTGPRGGRYVIRNGSKRYVK